MASKGSILIWPVNALLSYGQRRLYNYMASEGSDYTLDDRISPFLFGIVTIHERIHSQEEPHFVSICSQ